MSLNSSRRRGRERYYERKEKGLCHSCNKKAVENKTMCKIHLLKSRKRNRGYRESRKLKKQ